MSDADDVVRDSYVRERNQARVRRRAYQLLGEFKSMMSICIASNDDEAVSLGLDDARAAERLASLELLRVALDRASPSFAMEVVADKHSDFFALRRAKDDAGVSARRAESAIAGTATGRMSKKPKPEAVPDVPGGACDVCGEELAADVLVRVPDKDRRLAYDFACLCLRCHWRAILDDALPGAD